MGVGIKVVVVQEDLKMSDGSQAIYPKVGDVIDLPGEIAEAEIAAGFVQRVEGLEDDESVEPKKKKKKKKTAPVEEEEDDEG